MSKIIWDRRVLAASIACGFLISLSLYPLAPWFFETSTREFPHSIWWQLLRLVAWLNVVPRLFIGRLGQAGPLGNFFAFLYWPFIGALVGSRKHWVMIAVVVLVVHAGITAFIL